MFSYFVGKGRESEHNIELHNSHQLAAFLRTTSRRVGYIFGAVSPSIRRFPAGYKSGLWTAQESDRTATSSVCRCA